MTTVSELTRDILASTASDAGGALCGRWMNNRYQEMVSRVRFRHLREIGELVLPAVVPSSSEDSTVDCTRGSTAVSGTDTTWETSPTTSPGDEWFFRASQAWYRIASVTDDTNLVLDSAFSEDDVDDGSFKIVKRHHILGSTVRWIGDFYHTRLRRRLESCSLDELNIHAPGRVLVGTIPQYVAQVSVDATNGYITVEIYPPPLETEIIHYIYWKLPTALTLSGSIPQVIDPYTLKEGVLIDLYRFEMAAAIRKGNIEQAAIWRNEMRTQMSTWESKITQAIRTSRGADDITMILEMFKGTGQERDQRTARDYVYDNWSR